MTDRFFLNEELSALYSKNIVPQDIESGHVIGVSEVCSLSHIIEIDKITGVHEKVLKANFANVHNECEKGRVWILDLNAENLSRLLLDEEFYEFYCDKKDNPYILSRRISLYYDSSYSYWSDNVYTEAFQ